MRWIKQTWQFFQRRIEEPLEELELSPEEKREIEEMMKEMPIPEFTSRRTALFTTLGYSGLHFYNRFWYRWKIRIYAAWLLDHGYFTFVVNYSTRFGYLAMEELLAMRRAGGDFTLCSMTVLGERRYRFRHRGLDEVFMSVACDRQLGLLAWPEYLEKVMGHVDHIASESGLYRTMQAIPRGVVRYYLMLTRRICPAAFQKDNTRS